MTIKLDANYLVIELADHHTLVVEATADNLKAFNVLFKPEHAFVKRHEVIESEPEGDRYHECLIKRDRWSNERVKIPQQTVVQTGTDVAKAVRCGAIYEAELAAKRAAERAEQEAA
jgi:hypothetical protein